MSFQPTISVVMPFYKDGSAIHAALRSLTNQSLPVHEIVIVDDSSPDGLHQDEVSSYLPKPQVIRHQNNRGLSETYNTGINATKGDLVVLMHPDVILPSKFELKALIEPFRDQHVTAATHINSRLSEDYWQHLSLVEKSLLGSSEKNSSGFNGQFDCIRRSALRQVGGFNSIIFRTAGEDGDMISRLEQIGDVRPTTARAEHRHVFWPRSSIRAVLRKSFQYGRAQGALVRIGRLNSLIAILGTLYREVGLVAIAAAIKIFGSFVPLAAVLLVALPTPFLVLRRDKQYFRFVVLLVLQVVRDCVHMVGVLIGLATRRQSSHNRQKPFVTN